MSKEGRPRSVRVPVSLLTPDFKLEVSVSGERAKIQIVEDWKGVPKRVREFTHSILRLGEGGKIEEKDDKTIGTVEGKPTKVLPGAIIELFVQFISFKPMFEERETLLSVLHDIDRANLPPPPKTRLERIAKR